MGVVYLITSHRAPAQVARLARALRDESEHGRVLIHHDPKGPPLSAGLFGDRVTAIADPIDMRWGSWSQVELIVFALRSALALDDVDWIVLISGQDYPVSPLPAIEADLAARDADALLDHHPIDDDPEDRLRYLSRMRVLRSSPLTTRVPAPLRRAARGACDLASRYFTGVWVRSVRPMGRVVVGHRTRRLPLPVARLRTGSDWFSLNAAAARAVVEVTEAEGPLVQHFRHTLIPSEAYFQTLLCNRPELRIDSDFRRQISFGHRVAHPRPVTVGGVEAAARAGAHFARKFDLEAAPEALEAADRARERGRRPA